MQAVHWQSRRPPARLFLLIAHTVVLAFTGTTDAATFNCAVSWRAKATELYKGVDSASACQKRCEEIGACKFFYTTEVVSSPQIRSCHVMGTIDGKGYRDDAVMAICAYPRFWPQLAVPDGHVGSAGTFLPAPASTGKSGAYRRVADSTGVVAIHATMIPNTDNLIMFGRPQDPKYPPQPGMEVANTGVEWPSSIVNATTGVYQPVKSEIGAPFCGHQIHTVSGDILVCGGDDAYLNSPGNGGWGGFKGCRYLTRATGGQMEWRRLPNMVGAHWYPNLVELPPRVSGSRGTCALVLGGKDSTSPNYTRTDKVDIACLQMGVVFGGSVYDFASTPNVASALRNDFPTAYLLPVGDVPAPPQIVLFGEDSGDIVTLDIDFKRRGFKLTSIKSIRPPPKNAFSLIASSTLKAINLAGPVDKRTIEVIIFGGGWWGVGPFRPSNKVYRVKPLANNPGWQIEDMPATTTMRWPINLPNGKILLINGARLGTPGGGQACCSSQAGGPIMNVWIYDPARPLGQRFWVDPVLMSRFRLYHNTAWLALDGSIYLAGGDEAVMPNSRPDFTMDSYLTPALRKAIAAGVRPSIVSAPAKFNYGNNLTVTLTGGYASRCSLSKPVAATHTSASAHRMLLLKTIKNAMDKKVVRKGGSLVVATPTSAYVAPPGWWLLYCWHGDVWTAASWTYLNAK